MILLTTLLAPSAAVAEKVKFCILFCLVEQETVVVDGFCQQYNRLLTDAKAAEEVKKLSRPLKDRLVANEAQYRECMAKK